VDTYNITTPHILTTYKIYIHTTNTSAMAVELLLSPRFCPKKVQSGSFFFSGAVAVQSLGLKGGNPDRPGTFEADRMPS
jgi:hypothetical protein